MNDPRPSPPASTSSQPGAASPQPGAANPQPGAANPQPGAANPQPGPASAQHGSASGGPRPMDDLEQGLRELLPSLRLHDRDLALDGVPIADLVGEADGRLVLVLLADGEGDAPALAVLDALAAGRRDADLLIAHLGLAAGPSRPPLVLLVVERLGAALRGRLSAIPPDRLWLLERRAIRTAGRDAWHLVRCAPPGEMPPGPQEERRAASRGPYDPASAARFLAPLAPGPARLGRELIERIARIDPELEVDEGGMPGAQGLAWSFRGRPLCGLGVREGRLEGRLPGSPIPHSIHSPSSIDTFLEWVLTCHIELLEGQRERDEPGLVELIPSRREPLLSPEEIEAFRE